jgi:N-acetylglucosamine-6-phosphate deacetylase
LEGPYLNPEKKGTFKVAWLRQPLQAEVARLLEAGRGWVRQMTLAPELPDAHSIAAQLHEAGVVAALGHSNTDYATASEALASDFVHVTHTFNAQRGFHHREPGVLGAVLSSERVTAELIADTVHVHPGAMKVLVRCLGTERVVLITDAMAAAGLGDGTYSLVGHKVFVKEGRATEADGTIAGSTATLDACVRNMAQHVGVPAPQAIRMATYNPAMALGLQDQYGVLGSDCVADLVVLNEQLSVELTIVQGKVVYDRAGLLG